MSQALAPRTPALEWCHRAAGEELERLSWVDPRLDPDFSEHRQVRAGSEVQFRARAYLRQLPEPIATATLTAQALRVPTAWEGLALIFARPEWLVAGRRYLWAPQSPEPRLLATLVETFGIEADLHELDRDRLARLAALLPVWHPFRGTLGRAREVLEAVDRGDLLDDASTLEEPARGAATDLQNEVLAVHDLGWWEHRAEPGAEAELRIEGGLVRFQPQSGTTAPRFALRREDVLINWQAGRGVPILAVRLLPAWTVVRLAAMGG